MSDLLDKGVFLISLDTELAWGGVHNGTHAARRHLYEGTRDAIDKLLVLLEEYEIRATWAVVGHLFLRTCKPVNGQKHPELTRPDYTWFTGDWLECDPCSDVDKDPYWYGPDIVSRLLGCRVHQEIGCHSFSHIIVNDPGCSRECLDSELKACISAAREWGLTLKSFVYPRNEVAYLDALKANGFSCFRGQLTPTWQAKAPVGFRKISRGIQWVLPVAPLTGRPEMSNGMWNLPSSTYYLHRDGLARRLPVSLRVYRAKSGVREACRKKSIFHMYFHPFNLATDPACLLAGLEKVFRYVAERRSDGELLNYTMGELAGYLNTKHVAEVQSA